MSNDPATAIDTATVPAQRLTFPPPWLVPTFGAVALGAIVYFGYRYWEQRSIRLLSEACRAAIAEQDWERAEQIGRRWADFEPDETEVLVQLAEAARGQRAFDRMAEYLASVPDTDPAALTMLGLAAEVQFNELLRPFEAEQTWLRMLAIEPRANVPRKSLMYFYALTQQRAKLQAQVEEAIRTGSDTPDTYSYLMLLSDLLFSDAFPKVSHWLNQEPTNETLRVAQALALALAPENSDSGLYVGTTYQPRDRTLLEQCRRDFPGNLDALASDIKKAIDTSDPGQLRVLLEDLPPQADDDSRIWYARGWLLKVDGQLAEAEQALRKSLALYPFDWRVRHELSQVVRRLGRNEESAELAAVAAVGKDLQREILESPSTGEVPPEVLSRIGKYARQVGADHIADALAGRLGEDH